MKTITKKNAQKLANALRSGEFKQGHHKLQSSENQYCCLGVACKIFIPKQKLRYVDGLITGLTPREQLRAPRWLQEIDGDCRDKLGMTLVNLNDRLYYNFNEIADIIELLYIHKAIKEGDAVE